MIDVRATIRRLYGSSVVWSWAYNGFRVAGGLLVLPLLLHVLTKPDLGMYYVFLSLYALLPVIDFGFSPTATRYVSYAMGGATELKAMGLTPNQQGGGPNYAMLWQLVATTRSLYRYLCLAAFVLVGSLGTWTVSLRVHETSAPSITWLAWGITLVSLVLEIYAGWWNAFLRGMNEVLLSARITTLTYALKVVLAAIFLLMGGGLLAYPAAGLVCSLLQRALSRRSCLARLQRVPEAARPQRSLLQLLWPNSWRLGLQFLSTYLATSANMLICTSVLGLAVNAQFGLSAQVAQICAGMASVWVSVKWPIIGQYRMRHNVAGIRAVLWPRLWLQAVTFLVLAGGAYYAGPALLKWFSTHKQLLPAGWFALILLNAFLDLQFATWTTLLTLENRIPSLWPTVISNLASLGVVLALLKWSSLEVGAFIVGPLAVFSLFNYWYWALAGARSLK